MSRCRSIGLNSSSPALNSTSSRQSESIDSDASPETLGCKNSFATLTIWINPGKLIAIPVGLTVLRLVLGPVAIALALEHQPRLLFAPLLLAGMLSDIFDGVLARRFGVARPWLRRFDSMTDLIYYVCVFVTAWLAARETMTGSILPFALLAGSEILCLIVSFGKFGAMPATHTYAAKIYGLAIFTAFFAVLPFGFGPRVFWVLAAFGLVANLEIIVILARSRTAPVDVLSVFHLNRQPR